jgi:hypothetical protein
MRASLLVTSVAGWRVGLAVGHDVTNLTEGAGGPQDPAVPHTPGSITSSLEDLTVLRAERVRRPVAGSPREAVDTLIRAIRARQRGQDRYG